ncbi:MAG TPA: Gfo/Idh/MocA family oxidoreductase [Lunatimonas sp.]|nr:Gfo/Idh/MocA family oxidoreductase [Lunatimonas sp.]
MKKLKGVIVGAGYFSQFHGDAWSRMPDVEILAICDKDVQKAKLYAKHYGIPNVYGDLNVMFAAHQPDFVDIVTPPVTHKPIIKSAIAKGIHIICQKPLADTFKEAKEIRELVKKAGIRFMVHENWRFQPWYREIKSVIQAGTIGKKIFQYTFKMRLGDGWGEDAYLDRQPYFRNMPRLLIHETGVHFVDTFRYLEGEISEVYAHLKTLNPIIKGEDTGMVFFNFKSGCTALFDANRYHEPTYNNARYTFGEMWVEGDKGSLTLHPNGLISIKPLGEPQYQLPFQPTENGFSGDSVFACQDHFIRGILDESPFETGIDDYIKTLKVVEAIYHSDHEKTIYPINRVK